MAAPALVVSTPRLELIAATGALARADAADQVEFARLLTAAIPPAWPPEVLLDVREFFAGQLEGDPGLAGWWNWYAVQKTPRVLVGSGGFSGLPDESGTVTLGYSVVPGYEGKGFATEMAAGLLQWIASTGRAQRVFATTFERHDASVRILEKVGFFCKGVSSEDAAAPEADRQGRGKLMLFVREIA